VLWSQRDAAKAELDLAAVWGGIERLSELADVDL
jgi:hypothetical protein